MEWKRVLTEYIYVLINDSLSKRSFFVFGLLYNANRANIDVFESTMNYYSNKLFGFLLVLGLSSISLNNTVWAWTYYHGGGPGYYRPGYYGPGFYPGWGGPNVIINVPVVPSPPPVPYVRECETVQICNEYDECWLEKQCY